MKSYFYALGFVVSLIISIHRYGDGEEIWRTTAFVLFTAMWLRWLLLEIKKEQT